MAAAPSCAVETNLPAELLCHQKDDRELITLVRADRDTLNAFLLGQGYLTN